MNFSDYLQIQHIPGSGELTIICGALVGASLGFLWFNAPPAMVFMGDTGSLSIGSILGTLAIIIKHEIVLAIIGGLFVFETRQKKYNLSEKFSFELKSMSFTEMGDFWKSASKTYSIPLEIFIFSDSAVLK